MGEAELQEDSKDVHSLWNIQVTVGEKSTQNLSDTKDVVRKNYFCGKKSFLYQLYF